MLELSRSQQREEMVEAAGVLGRSGVMSHTGHINFSTRVDGERMLLTSSGLIQDLRADTLAVVGFGGQVEEGSITPSTQDIVGMHAAVYQARDDVFAVVHTHSPHLTAFALANRSLPCRYDPLLRRGQSRDVPVVPWALRGSQAFFRGIAAAVSSPARTNAVLLANHGILVFGSSAMAAVKLLIVLEEAAKLELDAAALGGARDFPPSAPTQRGDGAGRAEPAVLEAPAQR